MIEMTAQHPSRDARFPVLEGQKIWVTIERDGSSPEKIDANLEDISRKGMKLRVAAFPSLKEAIVLKVVVPELGVDLSIDAQVCWTRPAPDDAWYLGCSLHPDLPEKLLTDLAVKGYLQRRREPRQPVDLPGTMRCEGSPDVVPARVLDYSTGGFRLASSCTAATGRRLLLRFDEQAADTEPVVAKTMWQVQTPAGHQIGCTFVNRDGHRIFLEMLRRNQGSPHADRASGRRRSRWPLLALAALTGVFIFRYFFLAQS